MYATWLGAIAAVIAVASSIYFFLITQSALKEELTITGVQRMTVALTTIEPNGFLISTAPTTGTSGLASAYWRIFLSNNGDKDLSIIRYQVLQVSTHDFPAVSYTGLDQGLYIIEENESKPLNLPITVKSGETATIFIRVGVFVVPSSYQLILDEFGVKSEYQLREVEDFLRKEHSTDIYGNKLEQFAPGIWTYPALGEAKEQIFNVVFTTARGTKVSDLASWYAFSGFFNQTSP